MSEGYQPYSPFNDPYMMYVMQQRQAQQSQGKGSGGAAGGAIGAAGMGKSIYDIYKYFNPSTPASSYTVPATGGYSPVSGSTSDLAGGMSVQPPMSVEQMQSLSNGGNGLQSINTSGGQTPVPEQGTTLSDVGQGAAGLAQLYGGYKQFKNDKVGGGLHMAAGAANVAAPLGFSGAGTFGMPIAAPLTAAAGLYGMGKGINAGSRKSTAMSGAEAGAAIGSMIPGVGTLAGAGIGLLAGAAMGHIKTGKSQVQQMRDKGRGAVQSDLNLGKGNYNLNGFDFGQDGKHMLMNADGKTQRHAYDVDMNDKMSVAAIPKFSQYVKNLLGEGSSDKLQSDTVGMLVNAARNGAHSEQEVLANADKILSGSGMRSQPQSPNPQQPQMPSTGNASLRSKTSSPGIGKDGKRINYSGLVRTQNGVRRS